jgi:hypothetical protein
VLLPKLGDVDSQAAAYELMKMRQNCITLGPSGYPQQIANDALPVSNHPMEMTGSSPVMTGVGSLRTVRHRQGRLV